MNKPKKQLFQGIERKKPLDPKQADAFVAAGKPEMGEHSKPKSNKVKKLTLELDAELHKQFSIYCVQNDIKMSEYLRKIIRRELSMD